jgi:hypothetical protein
MKNFFLQSRAKSLIADFEVSGHLAGKPLGMSVALITLASSAVNKVYGSPPVPLILPNGDQVFNAKVGYTNGTYSLVGVTPFTVPGGQQIVGPPTYTCLNSAVSEHYTTQAIPPAQLAAAQFDNAINAGATLTWTVSTALNGTYTIDNTSLILMNIEAISLVAFSVFDNGTTSTQWSDNTGTLRTMTVAQFKAFIAGIFKLVRGLQLAQIQMAAGGNPTWPSNSISITG